MKMIVWKMPDGSIQITAPAEPKQGVETDSAYLDRVALKAQQPGAVRLPDTDSGALPDHEFFDQWRHDGQKIIIDQDLELAERWRRVRADRNARLAASDAAMLAQIELGGAKAAAWKAYRQALRDVPQIHPDPKVIVWPVQPA